MIALKQVGINIHTPVMPIEAISYLNISSNGTYIDGTIGTGGHATLILKQLSKKGNLIGIDRDEETIKICTKCLASFATKFSIFNDSYHNLGKIIDGLGINKVNGILLDLGLSSFQLDSSYRGFSFKTNSQLDMRFDTNQKTKANDILNQTSKEELANIIFQNSNERYSRKIANKIIEMRPLNTVFDLVEAIRRSTPPKNRNKSISRVFQAIRIKVNDELEILDKFLSSFYEKLTIGGRIVIISFHSLEDRKVKHCFKKMSIEKTMKVLTKKPLIPSQKEILVNSRSKSAKLRVAEKII